MNCSVIDLHCDTLTAFQAPTRCRDTLNDPDSVFALCKIPENTPWCQCCAVFVPDGLTSEEALGYYRFHRRSFQRQGAQFTALAQVCTTAGQMEEAWAQKKAALILTVENGSLLGTGLDKVEELHRDGVRLLTLTWNQPWRRLASCWTCPTSTTPGSGTCWSWPKNPLWPPTPTPGPCVPTCAIWRTGKSGRWSAAAVSSA